MQEHSPTCSLHARGQVRSTAQTRDSPILSPRKKVGGIWVFWQAHLFIEGMADSYWKWQDIKGQRWAVLQVQSKPNIPEGGGNYENKSL